MELFFKTYVCPAMQSVIQVTFFARCDKASLKEKEIDTSEEKEFSIIQCNICSTSLL